MGSECSALKIKGMTFLRDVSTFIVSLVLFPSLSLSAILLKMTPLGRSFKSNHNRSDLMMTLP